MRMRIGFAMTCIVGCGSSPAPLDAPISGDASTDVAIATDAAACGADIPAEEGVVVTTSGAVRGVRAGEVWSYRGIPFAEPPQPWRW